MAETLLIAIFGFAGGTVAGLLGVGGGVLFVPGLVIAFGSGQLDAEATSLAAIVPVAIVGSIRQKRFGNVRVADAVWLGALAIPGIAIGVVAANLLPERALEVGFAGLLTLVAYQLARRALNESAESSGATPADHARDSP